MFHIARNTIAVMAIGVMTHGLAAAPVAASPALMNPVRGPQQTAPGSMPPASSSATTSAPAKQGFVSKKTGKSLAEAEIEDITNDNFPDMIESFDYPNAEISDVIRAISELTGKNFVIDPQVRGKISIIAPSRITVAEAYKAFLSALAINGLAVVPGDGFYKIKQARAAQRDNIDTYAGAYYPASDQMITRIVKLKYISADEVSKQIRSLNSTNGEMATYAPTNSLIISDYGASVDRIMKILTQLDVQGFEEQMEVIRIKYTRSKDIAELIDQIINKGEKKGQFGAGVPRFRPSGGAESGASSGAEVFSVVVSDDRTNSIIVVGNKAGIEKIRRLVGRLDFPMRSDEQGGFFVYYLRHAEAEPIANMLNGIAAESKKALDQSAQGNRGAPAAIGPGGVQQVGPAATAIFGGEVKITADKNTNAIVIVASKPDYETVKTLIAKLDIPKDQVFIKAVILEMASNIGDTWQVNVYKFAKDTAGVGRIGFRGTTDVQSILNPAGDRGAVLGFGSGGLVDLTIGGTKVQVPSVTSFINLLKTNAATNVISTPQIMAINNQESMIEVGEIVPVARNDNPTTGGVVAASITREPITTKLTITPYISPDTDVVRMKLEQDVGGLSSVTIAASELSKNSIAVSTRKIKTQIVVNSGDTAVLGGLMKDSDSEETTKVPVLGDIPVIGWLFKSQTKRKEKTNLVVFITPRIVRHQSQSAAIVEEKLNERIDFIQRSMNGRDPHGRFIDDLPRLKPKAKAPPPPTAEEPAVESF